MHRHTDTSLLFLNISACMFVTGSATPVLLSDFLFFFAWSLFVFVFGIDLCSLSVGGAGRNEIVERVAYVEGVTSGAGELEEEEACRGFDGAYFVWVLALYTNVGAMPPLKMEAAPYRRRGYPLWHLRKTLPTDSLQCTNNS